MWAIMRKPTASRPISLAMPKCCSEMSASVHWVAMRTIPIPASTASLSSLRVPMPGRRRAATLARATLSRAARMRRISSTREKPYWMELPPSPSPWATSMA
jgi:hypothetical protein